MRADSYFRVLGNEIAATFEALRADANGCGV
jgi:hypothetical protein